MKVKIPDLLKLAIESNDMTLVCKAYTAITGDQIELPKTVINERSIASQTNKFFDDGSIASNDSPRNNPNVAKLYGEPQARTRAPNNVEMKCPYCGTIENISRDLAANYSLNINSIDKPVFKCNLCSMRKS